MEDEDQIFHTSAEDYNCVTINYLVHSCKPEDNALQNRTKSCCFLGLGSLDLKTNHPSTDLI